MTRSILSRLPVNRRNYPYVTARIKVKKRNLLGADAYPKLMKMQSSQIARLLGETAYRKEMLALAQRYSGSELIEKALNMNLARVYREILSFSKGDLKGMIRGYLAIWDVRGIKTILRGVEHSIPKEEVLESLVPAGSLSEGFLNELASQDSAEAVIDLLKQRGFAAPPQEIMARFAGTRNLSEIEDFYDRQYYRNLLNSTRGKSGPIRVYRLFVQTEIDVVNAKNLMMLKLEEMKPDNIMNYMIPGGAHISLDALRKLSVMETPEALNEIKRLLKDELNGVSAEMGAHRIALELDHHLMQRSEKLAHIQPLSAVPVIDFIIRKKKEVDFIRIIVKGKDNHLSEDMIKELLVL